MKKRYLAGVLILSLALIGCNNTKQDTAIKKENNTVKVEVDKSLEFFKILDDIKQIDMTTTLHLDGHINKNDVASEFTFDATVDTKNDKDTLYQKVIATSIYDKVQEYKIEGYVQDEGYGKYSSYIYDNTLDQWLTFNDSDGMLSESIFQALSQRDLYETVNIKIDEEQNYVVSGILKNSIFSEYEEELTKQGIALTDLPKITVEYIFSTNKEFIGMNINCDLKKLNTLIEAKGYIDNMIIHIVINNITDEELEVPSLN